MAGGKGGAGGIPWQGEGGGGEPVGGFGSGARQSVGVAFRVVTAGGGGGWVGDAETGVETHEALDLGEEECSGGGEVEEGLGAGAVAGGFGRPGPSAVGGFTIGVEVVHEVGEGGVGELLVGVRVVMRGVVGEVELVGALIADDSDGSDVGGGLQEADESRAASDSKGHRLKAV
jgi:hypothetical protein